MTEPVRRVAVTSGDLLNPEAAAIRAALNHRAAEAAEQRGRIIANALHIPVESDPPKPDPRQAIVPAKTWADQSPAERAEEAARSFEEIAEHLRRQKGSQS
jgi:formiminotetrahydrofolate cyclodeaminase